MRLAITGTPGTGKHTIAEALGKELMLEVVDLGKIAKARGLTTKDEERDTLVVDIERLKGFLPTQGILVSNYAELIPADMILVVRCHPGVLAERLAARGYTPSKIKENLMAECIDYCLASAIEQKGPVGEIDNSGEQGDAVQAAIQMVRSGRPTYGQVDYSEFVDKLDGLIATAINNSNL